jgi:MFS family permease
VVVGGVAGSLLGGVAADRAARRRSAGQLDVSVIAGLLACPLAAATLVVTWPPAYVMLAILTPVAVFAYFPPLQTTIVELVPPHRHGLAYAVNILFLGGIGTALGPSLVGALSDASESLRLALGAAVIGIAVGALLMVGAGRIVRARGSEPLV